MQSVLAFSSHLFLPELPKGGINPTRMICVGLVTSWRELGSRFPALSRRTSLGCRTLILTSCLFVSRCKVGQDEWPWGQLDRPRQPRLAEEEGLALRYSPEVRVPPHIHPLPRLLWHSDGVVPPRLLEQMEPGFSHL